MSKMLVYGTEGDVVCPKDGKLNEDVSTFITEMTSVPPWPIAYLDTRYNRFIQRFLSYKRTNDSNSRRPNNYFAVVDTYGNSSENLQSYSDLFSSIQESSFERKDSYDDDFLDPTVIEDAWENLQSQSFVPQTAAAKLVRQGNQQLWHVPDLAAGYILIAEYAALDCPTSAVITENANSDWSADVVIEIGSSREIKPSEKTEELLVEEITETYQADLENLVDTLSEDVRQAIIPHKQPPLDVLLAWIVFTGITLKNINKVSVVSNIIQEDAGAFITDVEEYRDKYKTFHGVNPESIVSLWEKALEVIKPVAEKSLLLPSGIQIDPDEIADFDTLEKTLTKRYRQYHLEAIEQYADRAEWSDEDWSDVQENIKRLRDEWVKPIDDPSWQIATWPVIRSLTGEQPVAKAGPLAESLNKTLVDLRESVFANELTKVDKSVEKMLYERFDQLESDQIEIRRRYLKSSETFGKLDYLIVLLPSYNLILVFVLLLVIIAAVVGYLFVL